MEHTLSAGTIIDGRYEILSVAGSGGMGTVFRAKHLDLGRLVAIKTLDPLLVSDPELFERFKREARVLSELKHPNISMFYSYGVLPSKLPYIAMEYLEGQTLAALLTEGAIPPKRAIRLALQICAAMECAHDAGVIHRDLKPQNIFLLNDPEPDYVKLLDFGLAKYETKAEDQVLTKTGELIGTPEFLSPEQCLGRKADERSDIYALCCIIYKMLTGRSPFESDSPVGFLTKHLNESPINPREISQNLPVGLELVVLKGMEKDPNDRQPSMLALADQLNSVLSNKGAKLDITISPSMQGKKKSSAKKLIASVLVVSALAVVATLLLAKNLSIESNKNKSQTLPELLAKVEQAKQSKDRRRLEQLMDRLENAARLQGNNPANKASACCDVAEELLNHNLKEEASQMARAALADLNAVSANFSRGNYTALGPVMPLVDKFMDTNKVDTTKLDDTDAMEARKEEWIKALQKISERAATILVKTDYKPTKKVLNQCCHQIEQMRNSGFIFSSTARLIIGAYQRGQAPLNNCVIQAYQDIDVENLRRNDTEALRKSTEATEAAMKKLLGEKTPKIPYHHFNLCMDWVGDTESAAKKQEYQRGFWLVDHGHYDKGDMLTAKLFVRAGEAADKHGSSLDRQRFYKLAYENLKDEHNITDRAQVILSYAKEQFRNAEYSLAMKLTKEGLEALAADAEESYQRPELVLLKARTLMRLEHVSEACEETEREIKYLRQHLPGSGLRLEILLSTFAQELLMGKDCFGRKETAHSYLKEALPLTKYLPDSDGMPGLSNVIGNILVWDYYHGTNAEIEADWSLLSSQPDEAWQMVLSKHSVIVLQFAKHLQSRNLFKLSAQLVEKSSGLATKELSTPAPNAEIIATAIRILKDSKEDARAKELRAQAKAKLPKEESEKL